MGRGARGEFEERERARRRELRGMARDRAWGASSTSAVSATAAARPICAAATDRGSCRSYGPPLTYFRAGMVVGAGSESYRTLRYLVSGCRR